LAETEFKDALNKHIFRSPARTFGLGLILTSIIQSSSLSTSFIVPLAGVGIITLEKAFPYILGANIGTTFTAFLASLVTGSPAALTVALEHILFNTAGTILIYPIRKVPIAMASWLANLTLKSRIYPIAYVATTFYVLPFCVVILFQYI